MTTRQEAIRAAGAAIAEAYAQLDELPVEEAARAAYTPTGPPLAELEQRIRARRGLDTRESGAA
ncbi:hypothetical protein [Ruania rhizosphaerae]|uniref:hypothetical protein n=1 Tax=Ruania rhizosphaerae TaxID=1840413 RepID=UPI001359A41F|nr:hypothetical protein [Ruania rhizosphaerae]